MMVWRLSKAWLHWPKEHRSQRGCLWLVERSLMYKGPAFSCFLKAAHDLIRLQVFSLKFRRNVFSGRVTYILYSQKYHNPNPFVSNKVTLPRLTVHMWDANIHQVRILNSYTYNQAPDMQYKCASLSIFKYSSWRRNLVILDLAVIFDNHKSWTFAKIGSLHRYVVSSFVRYFDLLTRFWYVTRLQIIQVSYYDSFTATSNVRVW